MKIDGVKAAKVNQRKGEAVVTYDGSKTNPEAIARTITKQTGFAAAVAPKRKAAETQRGLPASLFP